MAKEVGEKPGDISEAERKKCLEMEYGVIC